MISHLIAIVIQWLCPELCLACTWYGCCEILITLLQYYQEINAIHYILGITTFKVSWNGETQFSFNQVIIFGQTAGLTNLRYIGLT